MRISKQRIQEWEHQGTNDSTVQYSTYEIGKTLEMFPTLGVEVFRFDSDGKDKCKIPWL